MTKRDIIFISALVNVGLLAVLFLTASHFDDEEMVPPRQEAMQKVVAMAKKEAPQPLPVDEVDQTIRRYFPEMSPPPPDVKPVPVTAQVEPQQDTEKYVEVTVKQGDALERLARAYGVTVQKIQQVNHLRGQVLRPGQVLKIPATKTPPPEEEPVYYIVKSGDNPWTIARDNHVDLDDLLKLNNLDEARAKRLKAGERLRVK